MPLRVCQPSMSARKPAGRCSRSTSRRNEIAGCAVVTTLGAAIARPVRQRHPGGAPVADVDPPDRRAGADLRAERPRGRGQRARDAAHAAAREAPRARPAPSPRSPTWWWSMTYAVPADRGPAQVPMTPDTESTPRTASDSKRASTRSAMLSLSSRTTSTAARSSTPRRRRSSRACRARSAGLREPSFGGMSCSSGPSRAPRWPRSRSQRRVGVGVPLRELRDLRVALGGVVRQAQVAAVAPRREVRALRVDVIAVPLELQGTHQCGRQQRDDVGERRHRVVRAERVLADGGSADDVPRLADEDGEPFTGQEPGRDQAVVAAADHDDVILPRVHHSRVLTRDSGKHP